MYLLLLGLILLTRAYGRLMFLSPALLGQSVLLPALLFAANCPVFDVVYDPPTPISMFVQANNSAALFLRAS